MSRRKLFGIRILVLCLIVVGLAVALPALSHDEPCPPPFETKVVVPETGADKNGNGRVCSKDVPGNGNGFTPGAVEKDDHRHEGGAPLPLVGLL